MKKICDHVCRKCKSYKTDIIEKYLTPLDLKPAWLERYCHDCGYSGMYDEGIIEEGWE